MAIIRYEFAHYRRFIRILLDRGESDPDGRYERYEQFMLDKNETQAVIQMLQHHLKDIMGPD